MEDHFTLRQKLRYHWDNLMSRGPAAMLAVLALATCAMVAAVGALITLSGVHPDGHEPHGMLENVWIALMRTLDPGNVSEDVGWPFRLVMLTITLAGIFIVSALISILSSGLTVRIDELRKGRSLVVEKGHTVILGWSPKIFTILHELVLCNHSRSDACIVILAERDKVAMEDELRLKIPGRGRTRFVCRSGNPTDPHDLELVSPQRAKAIVIMAPEGPNPDAETIKTILALTNRRGRNAKPYHIVAELRESENLRLARLVGKEEVEFVAADDLVARLTVQSCRQLGLSLVYSELMDFAGGEMYFHVEPALVGKTFAECILSYPHSAVVGVQRVSGKVTVNPSKDYALQAGDRVVVLAEDDSKIRTGKVPPPSGVPLPTLQPQPRRPEKVLVLGWNDKAPIVMRELDRYMPRGSSLTLVSTYDVGKLFDEQVPMLNNLTTEYWTSPTSDRGVLDGLDLIHFSHVLVLAYSEHLEQHECDAQTLMTLLHLRDICDTEKHSIGILSEMLDVRNRELAEVTQADDFVVSDRLVSLVMSQVAHNKDVMRIFDDLFHIEGSEMFLKPVEHYVSLEGAVNFYQVAEAAITKNETALGYRLKSDHFDPSKNYGLHINPLKSDTVRFCSGDQVIVLAETDV
jgi:voltage-gated potassium channel Kch/K+/H+ antiporter YhaU regulatory subunit KhtT